MIHIHLSAVVLYLQDMATDALACIPSKTPHVVSALDGHEGSLPYRVCCINTATEQEGCDVRHEATWKYNRTPRQQRLPSCARSTEPSHDPVDDRVLSGSGDRSRQQRMAATKPAGWRTYCQMFGSEFPSLKSCHKASRTEQLLKRVSTVPSNSQEIHRTTASE